MEKEGKNHLVIHRYFFYNEKEVRMDNLSIYFYPCRIKNGDERTCEREEF